MMTELHTGGMNQQYQTDVSAHDSITQRSRATTELQMRDYMSTHQNPLCDRQMLQGQSSASNYKATVTELNTASSGKQSQSHGSLLDSQKKRQFNEASKEISNFIKARADQLPLQNPPARSSQKRHHTKQTQSKEQRDNKQPKLKPSENASTRNHSSRLQPLMQNKQLTAITTMTTDEKSQTTAVAVSRQRKGETQEKPQSQSPMIMTMTEEN